MLTTGNRCRMIGIMSLAACFLVGTLVFGIDWGSETATGYLSYDEHTFKTASHFDEVAILDSMMPTDHVAPMALVKPKAAPVSWAQADFLKLIATLTSEETKQGAKIEEVYFALPCNYVSFGPQALGVKMYRVTEYKDRQIRLETYVDVDAQAGYMRQAAIGYYPPKAVTDIGELGSKIPAEAIVRIAEQAGGTEFRESRSNNCIIQGSLVHTYWLISYRPSPDSVKYEGFNITLDAITGQIVK